MLQTASRMRGREGAALVAGGDGSGGERSNGERYRRRDWGRAALDATRVPDKTFTIRVKHEDMRADKGSSWGCLRGLLGLSR